MLGGQDLRRAEDFASFGRVFGGGQVRMRAGGASGGQFHHLRPQCGEDAPRLRDLGRVEFVEVRHERGVRLGVVAGRFRMSDAYAEQESPRVRGFESVIGLRHLSRR